MAEQICVCPQCGKKYKLKEGFDAKSFSCKACGATVWVSGKPPVPAPTSRRAPAGAAPSPRKGGRAHAAAAAHGKGGRRSRGREAAEHEEEGGRRGRGRETKKSNANVLMAVGAVAVIGIIVVIALMSGDKDKGGGGTVAQQPSQGTGGTGMDEAGVETDTTPPPAQPEPGTPGTATPETQPASPAETEAPKGAEEAPSPEGGEQPTKLGGGDKKPAEGALGRNDPPSTLGHLDSTPPEVRKQIDELIAVLFDPFAGRDCHEAKEKLAAIGKPAFLPILGKMAAIRDTITDVDSQEEKDMESSLMLADRCLRDMDGFLDASGKQIIRPGTDKKYIKYILVLHYRRWNDGLNAGTPLKDMPEMPGAFDPSKLPPDEGGEEEK